MNYPFKISSPRDALDHFKEAFVSFIHTLSSLDWHRSSHRAAQLHRVIPWSLSILHIYSPKDLAERVSSTLDTSGIANPFSVADQNPDVDLFAGMKKKKKKVVALEPEDAPSPAAAEATPEPEPAPSAPAPIAQEEPLAEPSAPAPADDGVPDDSADLFADMKKKKKKKKEIPMDLVGVVSSRSALSRVTGLRLIGADGRTGMEPRVRARLRQLHQTGST